MNARRASRELALIVLSQFEDDIEKITNKSVEDIILNSVRILSENSKNELKNSLEELLKIRSFIEQYEAESEENLSRPIDAENLPVAIPMTSDMIGRIDEIVEASEKALNAIEISEMSALTEKVGVKKQVIKILKAYQQNKEIINAEINKFSIGWNIERMIRIDRDILRLAISEMIYMGETPYKVVIDEAVELAKKYSLDKSSSYINGILRQVVESHQLQNV